MPTAPAAPSIHYGSSGTRSFAAYNSGAVTSFNADLAPLDLGDKIWSYWKDRAPTVSAVMKVNSRPVISPVFYHFEQQPMPQYATCTAAAAAATTPTLAQSLTFANDMYKRMLAQQLWVNLRSWEVIRIEATPTTSTVTVTRSWGARPGAAVNAGDRWRMIGYAGAENEGAPDSHTTLAEKETFRIQDFRTAIEMSTRMRAARFQIEPDMLAKERSMKMWEHKQMLTSSYFWGTQMSMAASSLASATGDRTSCTGLIDWANVNTINCAGGLSWGDLNSHIAVDLVPWIPSGTLVMITSAAVKSIISNWGLEKVQLTNDVKSWGIDIDTLVTIGGKRIAIIEEEMFNESPEMQGMAFIGSLGLSSWRGFDQELPYDGQVKLERATRLIPNIKRDNNPTTYKEELFTSGGWEFWARRAWSVMWNIKW